MGLSNGHIKQDGFGMNRLSEKEHMLLKHFFVFLIIIFSSVALLPSNLYADVRPIFVVQIDGTINPATADYLSTSISQAEKADSKLLVLELNTPGGLLPSTQTMVELLLNSKIPTVVYVTPSGGGAVSAGVFITLAGHFAVMAPGTRIGAAHPVTGTGDDISGDMRTKVENDAVKQLQAICEQRGRNFTWAEKAVRESVSASDREALQEKVIDFIAVDRAKLLAELEGRTVNIKGQTLTLTHLSESPQQVIQMSFKQSVINVLSDPNIAILLGLCALLGIGLELYHPGGIVPGVVGVICLVLALTAAQVLPINYGGLALLLLGVIFFVVELFMPTFGVWGIAGVICLVLGSIYLIDAELIWGEAVGVNVTFIGAVAALVGLIFMGVGYLVLRTSQKQVTTGKEGLIHKQAIIKTPFSGQDSDLFLLGKVFVMGEYWNAKADAAYRQLLLVGQAVKIVAVEDGMRLVVEPDVSSRSKT